MSTLKMMVGRLGPVETPDASSILASTSSGARGLPFSLVSDLLEKSSSTSDREEIAQIVVDWFKVNRELIDSPDCNVAALLSTLLPEKRTDRVFCIRAPRLQKIIATALSIGRSRIQELEAYKEPGRGVDLADCVEKLLTRTPNPVRPRGSEITVEEIDNILHDIASRIRWSSPSVRALDSTISPNHLDGLAEMYRQVSPKEAKWLTRLVLKDFEPLIFRPGLIYGACHKMLPPILSIHDNFIVALQTLQMVQLSLLSSGLSAPVFNRQSLTAIKPMLSVKVGRQLWFKARSIKHCLHLCQGRMSVEKKLDGEYCQIHINASKGKQGIQIFSKSGKDSTEDRQKVHQFIADSLKLGQHDCPVNTECILEGELLVYSDNEQKILPFHHIRNHVERRGRLIHADYDSRPRPGEHLMIVYYDILLLDGESMLDKKHSQRFHLLEQTIHCTKGEAEIVPRQIIDTGHRFGASALRNAFAKVIRERGEGLVLKADLPYFNYSNPHLPFNGRCIKLKKEYIGEFGEVGDFAIVGAGYNPKKARSYNIPDLKWTHFFIGCLDNIEEVRRWGAKPSFVVVNEIDLNETMLKTFLAHGSTLAVEADQNQYTIIKRNTVIEVSGPLITAFSNPPVLDVRCFSFEKMADAGFWGLRFPIAAKIHFDRDYSDTISFYELQEIAKKAITTPEMEDSQENLDWIARLESADPRGVAVDASTQETTTTVPSPAPPEAPNAPSSLQSVSSILLSSEMQNKLVGVPGGKHALSQDSNVTPARPLKRCQTETTEAQHGVAPTEEQGSPSRRPFGEIGLNFATGSQQSNPGGSERPALSFSESQTALPGNLDHQDPTKGHNPEIVVNMTLQISITSEAPSPDDPEANAEVQTATDLAPTAEKTCRFVGSKCHLAKKVILLDSSLQIQTAELRKLLKDHGLTGRIIDPRSWVAEDRLRSLAAKEWQPGRGALLLVDSLTSKAETKSLILAMEEMRKDIPNKYRNWIDVYDWRVLKHVSILEDEEITKKYYDGFSNPWQRWSFGLI